MKRNKSKVLRIFQTVALAAIVTLFVSTAFHHQAYANDQGDDGGYGDSDDGGDSDGSTASNNGGGDDGCASEADCSDDESGLGSNDSDYGSGGSGAAGQTLGTVITNTITSSSDIPGLLSGFAYLMGLVLGAMGIVKMKEHVENPQQVHLSESVKRFLAGGGLFALPMVIEATYTTLTNGVTGAGGDSGFNVAGVTGSGLDAMVVSLMKDIYQPMTQLIGGFAYLAGIVLVIIGIMRLLKTSQEGPRGPGGIGTIMTFITAGAFFSADTMMGAWSNSLFGTDTISSYGSLAFTTGMADGEAAHVNAVINGVEAFIMILGWISFIRGWFIMRGVAEGDNQASLMAGMTHLFGGALAVNLGPLISSVQSTLGLSDYGINFTSGGA